MAALLPVHLASAEVAIRDPATDPDQLWRLFRELYPLGLGPRASDALFDETRRLIWLIAQNPNAPTRALAEIAAMSCPAARSVARNPGFAMALMVDPFCTERDTLMMVRNVAQRWPSDNDVADALRPLLDRTLSDPAARDRVEAIVPTLTDRYKKFHTKTKWPVREALADLLNPRPRDDRTTDKSCLVGRGWISCDDLLNIEISLESALTNDLDLRFERWFEGVRR